MYFIHSDGIPPQFSGLDAKGRNTFSTNLQLKGILGNGSSGNNSDPVLLDQEIARYLEFKGVGVLPGTNQSTANLFFGSTVFPDGEGPYLIVVNTGGFSPHDLLSEETVFNWSIQLFSTAKSYTQAYIKCFNAYNTVRMLRNFEW